MDYKLNELKRRRLEQLKEMYEGQQGSEQQMEESQQLKNMEDAAKARMTREALQRYGTLKLAHPDTATRITVVLAQAIHTGRLQGQVTDEELLRLLKRLDDASRKQREARIVRK